MKSYKFMENTLQNSTRNLSLQDVLQKLPNEFNPNYGISRQLRGTKLQSYQSGYKLSKLQKNVLTGLMLGDGAFDLRYSGSKKTVFAKKTLSNASLKCEQKNGEYLTCLYIIFQDIIGTPIRTRFVVGSKKSQIKSYSFKTYANPVFQFYINQWYEIDQLGNRRKQIPKLIHRWLTAEALAIWFQDDGNKFHSSFILNTQGFLLYEIKRLQNALKTNFGIESTIQKDKLKKDGSRTLYKIYIRTTSAKIFQSHIEPFLVPSMRYKLHPELKY